MSESLTLAPTSDARVFRSPEGRLMSPPDGWACLPPGDAGLTRRVKAAGPSWVVVEKRGRKVFSRGLWAPAAHIETARAALVAERATPAYARRREGDVRRREEEQAIYVAAFAEEVWAFLRVAPPYQALGRKMADQVTKLATPVGSGTVARTERISIEERAEAAVIAWMRHQTTAYDHLVIPRVKGMRRQVRRQLAEISRALLDLHRRPEPHVGADCALCVALAASG